MLKLSTMMVSLLVACVPHGLAVASEDGVRVPDQSGGTITIPKSSIPNPSDAGKAGHTNVEIYTPPKLPNPPTEDKAPEKEDGK